MSADRREPPLHEGVFPVDGMTCASCSGRVEKALLAIAGVRTATVNLATMTAHIDSVEPVPATRLIAAIEGAGFTIPDSEARLALSGMHCAACVGRVQKALLAVPGVVSADVSLTAESADVVSVAGMVSTMSLIAAVKAAGFEATVPEDARDARVDRDRRDQRLLLAILLLSFPFLVNMAVELWTGSPFLPAWAQLALATPVFLIGGARFHGGAWRALQAHAANMDVLVSLGSTAAYGLALWQVWQGHQHHLTFEASSLVIAFVLLGKQLEARARRATGGAVAALAALRPPIARIMRNGVETEAAVSDVQSGDHLIVRPGERIPVDGCVIAGSGEVDEAMITGESAAVLKGPGDSVVGGALNGAGRLEIATTTVGSASRLARIIRLVERAQSSKAPIQTAIDRIAAIFVPAVVALSAATFAGWLLVGADGETALVNAISLLVVSCPCALGLATPAAVAVGMGAGARYGILVKDATALDLARKISIMVFDKTGTLTLGRPTVSAIVAADGDQRSLLAWAASAEQGSEHAIARAILLRAREEGIALMPLDAYSARPGRGLEAMVAGESFYIGNAAFMSDTGVAVPSDDAGITQLEQEGATVFFIASARTGEKPCWRGYIAVTDVLRPQAGSTIAALTSRGVKTLMLTGDAPRVARSLAAKLVSSGAGLGAAGPADADAPQPPVLEVIAGVTPEGKIAEIIRLRAQGQIVGMAGDGINDAPALAEADVGIAMGAGSEAALEAASVALPADDLTRIVALIDLSRATVRKIQQNLFLAFAYNIVMIPAAAFGVLSPVAAGAAMALSSVSVVCNALLLRGWRPDRD